jgi:nucleoside 2-deoxyribosyltransferase
MIYIAAPYDLHPRAQALAAQLRAAGVLVCSTWHDEPRADRSRPASDAEARRLADQCLRELCAASRVVVIVPPEGGAGCFFEAGFALGLNIPIDWIGPRRLVFDAVGRRFETSKGWIDAL